MLSVHKQPPLVFSLLEDDTQTQFDAEKALSFLDSQFQRTLSTESSCFGNSGYRTGGGDLPGGAIINFHKFYPRDHCRSS